MPSDLRVPPSIPPVAADHERPRRHRRWPYVVVVGALLVVWLAVSAVSLVQARHDANLGMDLLRQARSTLTPTDVVRGQGADTLAAAERDFARAHDRANRPWLKPLEFLPVVGRQVRSIDSLTGSARRVVAVGADAMTRSRAQLSVPTVDGAARVAQVRALGTVAGDAWQQLRSVDLGPSNALLGPLRDARTKFSRDLTKLRNALKDVDEASVGLAQLLQGPSRYLVVAANNAEMRAGSGMWLSAGVLDVQGGRFTMGTMTSTPDLALDPGVVPVTGDLAARWSWTVPNEEWRNLMMSPQLPANAELASRMWRARSPVAIDGVLVIDPVALQALLAASGPVNVDGKVIDANNVVGYVLHDQYYGASFADARQQERREQLSGIARAAIEGIDQRGWDASKLVDQLRTAAQGRHVLAWSSNPVQEKAWKAAGISGTFPSDSLMVSMLNRGGNKLDQFVHVDPTLAVAPDPKGTAVTVQVAVANATPPDQPFYIEGPFPGTGLGAGEYLGILAVNVPADASNVSIDDGAPLVAAGADGDSRVVATYVRLARGQNRTLTVRFTLPAGARQLDVQPSARIPTEHWRFQDQEWEDSAARIVTW